MSIAISGSNDEACLCQKLFPDPTMRLAYAESCFGSQCDVFDDEIPAILLNLRMEKSEDESLTTLMNPRVKIRG